MPPHTTARFFHIAAYVTTARKSYVGREELVARPDLPDGKLDVPAMLSLTHVPRPPLSAIRALALALRRLHATSRQGAGFANRRDADRHQSAGRQVLHLRPRRHRSLPDLQRVAAVGRAFGIPGHQYRDAVLRHGRKFQARWRISVSTDAGGRITRHDSVARHSVGRGRRWICGIDCSRRPHTRLVSRFWSECFCKELRRGLDRHGVSITATPWDSRCGVLWPSRMWPLLPA